MKWTEQALTDLKAVYDFIARDAEAYAELLVEELFHDAERLADGLDEGMPMTESDREDLVAWSRGGFRLLCQRTDDEFYVLAVCPNG